MLNSLFPLITYTSIIPDIVYIINDDMNLYNKNISNMLIYKYDAVNIFIHISNRMWHHVSVRNYKINMYNIINNDINRRYILHYAPNTIIRYISSVRINIGNILNVVTLPHLVKYIIDYNSYSLVNVDKILHNPGQISTIAMQYILTTYAKDIRIIEYIYDYLNDYKIYTNHELYVVNAILIIKHMHGNINIYMIVEILQDIGDDRINATINKYVKNKL